MDCQDVLNSEIAERYVAGELSETEQSDFEAHFFGCEACFEEVQLLQAAQAALRRKPPMAARRAPSLRWLAAAAGLLIILGAGWWAMGPARRSPAGIQSAQVKPAAPARAESLALLAKIEPPRYSTLVMRGDGQQAFRDAMRSYSDGNYNGAIPVLLAVAEKDPRHSAAQFYLGICYLMLGRNDEAIARLKNVVALGDTPELEDAHIALAKAFLREANTAGAEEELRQTIVLSGDRKAEAQGLLDRLRNLAGAR
jgi:tetratricopeptide (TPR) repeat protein